MRRLNATVFSATNATGNGSQVDANQMVAVSFHAIFSDAAAAGTLKVQASNDLAADRGQGPFTVTNWVDVPNATATVTSGASALITIAQSCYGFVRVVWTRSAGAGTVTVNMQGLAL